MSESGYTLYGGTYSRSLLTEMVLVECGLDYTLEQVDIMKRENRSPEFLKVNPAGWVPALITPEGEMLHETPAINLYLAERHGAEHLAPAPGDPLRGRFLSALFYVTGEIEPAMKRYFFPHRYGAGKEDADVIKARAREHAMARLEVVNGLLSEAGPYHLGGRFSLADLTLAYWTAHLGDADTLGNLAAVNRCTDLVYERPKVRALLEKREEWYRVVPGFAARFGEKR